MLLCNVFKCLVSVTGNLASVHKDGNVAVDSDGLVHKLAVNGLHNRLGLLLHVADDAISISGTVVFAGGVDVLTEDLECGIAGDIVLLGKGGLDSAVDFAEENLPLELVGGGDVVGSKVLAVTAPGGVELDDGKLGGADHFVKVCLGESDNVSVVVFLGKNCVPKNKECEKNGFKHLSLLLFVTLRGGGG